MSSFSRPAAFDSSHPSRMPAVASGKDLKSKDDTLRAALGFDAASSDEEGGSIASDDDVDLPDSGSSMAVVDGRKAATAAAGQTAVQPPRVPHLTPAASMTSSSFARAFGQEKRNQSSSDVLASGGSSGGDMNQSALEALRDISADKNKLTQQISQLESKMSSMEATTATLRRLLLSTMARKDASLDAILKRLSDPKAPEGLLPFVSDIIQKQKNDTEATKRAAQKTPDDMLDDESGGAGDADAALRAQARLLKATHGQLKAELSQLRDIKRIATAVLSSIHDTEGPLPPSLEVNAQLLAEAVGQAVEEAVLSPRSDVSAGSVSSEVTSAIATQRMQDEIATGKKHLGMLKAELQNMTNQSKDSRAKMEDAIAKRDALAIELRQKAGEVERLQTEITHMRLVTEKLRAAGDAGQKLSARDSAAVEELRSSLERVQLERDEFKSKMVQLSDDLESARRGQTEARASNDSSQDKLAADLAAAGSQVDAWKSQCRDLEQALADAKRASATQLQQLQEEITHLKQVNAETTSAAGSASQTLADRVNVLSTTVKERDTQILDLQSTIDRSAADLKATKDQLASTTQQLHALEASVAASSASSSELSKKVGDLQALLASKEEAFTKEKGELQQRVASLSENHAKQLSTEAQKAKDAEDTIAALKRSLAEAQQKFEQDCQQLKAQKQKDEASLRRQLALLSDSKKGIIPVASKLQSAASSLHEQNNSLRTNVAQMDQTLRDSVREMTKSIGAEISKQAEAFAALNARYRKEVAERRRLHNLVQELRGNIRVYCRVRPPLAFELDAGASVCVAFPDQGEIQVSNAKRQTKTWEFDQIFKPNSTNEEVFRETEDLITSSLDGFNVCIFAYGQTGSGKTFTMEGTEESRGVNHRALVTLFNGRDERRGDVKYDIAVSMLEIYNENIHDMLAVKATPSDAASKLTVREGPSGVFVPELTMKSVDGLDDVLKIMRQGYRNRTTFATNMNEHSSRSHCMLSIYVMGTHKVTGQVYKGKLHLVDLAGSERVSKSGVTGDRLKEAQSINKSLSALGDVIQARAEKRSHVPYRNSTLTYLLSDSLGGDSKTLMFVNLSPIITNAEETFCSLNFAARVRTVELGKATKHVSKGPAAKGAGAIADVSTPDDDAEDWGLDADGASVGDSTPRDRTTPTHSSGTPAFFPPPTPKSAAPSSTRGVMSPSTKPPVPSSAPTAGSAARRMIAAKK